MTRSEHRNAGESWAYYRSAFSRRSRHFPNLAVLVAVIDRVCELGYAERLYAGASLDNLVISVRPQTSDRHQTILVVPKGESVEFRFYPEDGETEISTTPLNQVESEIDRLLPRLAATLVR